MSVAAAKRFSQTVPMKNISNIMAGQFFCWDSICSCLVKSYEELIFMGVENGKNTFRGVESDGEVVVSTHNYPHFIYADENVKICFVDGV